MREEFWFKFKVNWVKLLELMEKLLNILLNLLVRMMLLGNLYIM